ncbi:MAG: hypothetical protein KA135_07740, partial [Halioglobus sp.]|nr:hypothetical protein [Halioglobus sp.]
FYLRDAGLELSWVGSGRMIMSFNFSDEDFEEVASRFIAAASRMAEDGWWWQSQTLTDQSIQKLLLMETLLARFPLLARLKFKAGTSAGDLVEEAR